MKKVYLAALLSCLTPSLVNAQIGKGGFPLSFSASTLGLQDVSKIVLERPDYEALEAQDLKDLQNNVAKAYRVGVNVGVNKGIHNSGSWSYLDNGSKVWRLKLVVPDAKALGVYYSSFNLPKGVSLFLTNENKNQVLGAYTSNNNTENGKFSNQPIQGNVVNIELNIDPSVNIDDIKLEILSLGAYYKGVDADVAAFENNDIFANPINPPGVLNQSASCHIDVVCPQNGGEDLAKARSSEARIVATNGQAGGGIGFCSGTIINNTANTAANCKALFLTASHCEGDNGHSDATFQFWQFRMNYQRDSCGAGAFPTSVNSPTLTEGAKFKSRSNYPSFTQSENMLVQDFLLLELNDAVPEGYYMAGWNRESNLHQNPDYYQAFFGFHHPGGDIKKLMRAFSVNPASTFNQNAVPATHWGISANSGGSAPGSSGSGLFDIDGLVIGDLSGGPSANCAADGKSFGTNGQYSKVSYGWENVWEQTSFPANAGAASRLKDHLDPLNSGAVKLQPTNNNCTDAFTSIKNADQLPENVVNLFPNPSFDGQITAKFNFDKNQNVVVTVINVLGQEVNKLYFNGVSSQSYKLDLSNQANGVYMINFNVDGAQVSKKIIINK